jgi:8-oxo-dGTP pyrophosphatase MutT (NUDIX family)
MTAIRPELKDLLPPGMFVGVSLILGRRGRFLYGIRPARIESTRCLLELTGIGGGIEPDDESLWDGSLREAREEIGCDVAVRPCRLTQVVRGVGDVQSMELQDRCSPASVVYRGYKTPAHEPWHPQHRGEACLVVYSAQLLGEPVPSEELPYLIWLLPRHVAAAAQADVRLVDLLEDGAELVTNQAVPAGCWARLTDSQEALAIALGAGAEAFYHALCVPPPDDRVG